MFVSTSETMLLLHRYQRRPTYQYASPVDQALWQQFADAVSPASYYQSWLALQCRMIPEVSEGVVVLGTPERGLFAPAAFWPSGPRSHTSLAEVAERVLAERHSLILKRDIVDAAGTLIRQRYHVAHPIHVTGQVHGVVALDMAPRSAAALQEALHQLQWGAAWLEVLFLRQEVATRVSTQSRPQIALELAAIVFEHDRFQAVATALVTELATRLACERVSLGCVRGTRVYLHAVSHSAHFNKKTNLARAIEAAMDEALDQEATMTYPRPPDAAFQITRAHETLVRQHGAGTICSVLLPRDGRIIGVLTLERPTDDPFDTATVELCEAVGMLVGPVLDFKRREDRWLASKAAETLLTQLGRLLGPRYLGRKLGAIGLLVVSTFFAVAKVEYRVAAPTVLEPAIKRVVVAPFVGYIATAPVRAGNVIQTGEVLCSLDDRDLKLERLKWLSQKEQYVRQYQVAMAQHNAALVKIVTAQIAQAEAELALVDDHLSRAQLRAPFAGVVVSGDLSQSIGAPVERGDVLFEVAPLAAYRVILLIDERDIAEVVAGQRGHLVLSAFPTEPLAFAVEQVTPVSVAREGRNYFRVEAHLLHTPARLRPGMEGVGKIDIERRLLLWIWTHDALDWLRLLLWSWWP